MSYILSLTPVPCLTFLRQYLAKEYSKFRLAPEALSFKEHKISCNFKRGHHEEQFCEIILNLDKWFRRCCLKDFLSRALASSCSV